MVTTYMIQSIRYKRVITFQFFFQNKTGFDIGQLRGSLPKKFLTVAQSMNVLPIILYELGNI